MAEGDDQYRGLAVPLQGNFEIRGISSSLDIMTITQAGSATGDYIVCQNSAGTEHFRVEDDGKIVTANSATLATGLTITAGDAVVTAGDVQITNGYYLRFTSWPTTVPTTGLTLGDMFLIMKSTLVAAVGICTDSTQNTVRYLNTTSTH